MSSAEIKVNAAGGMFLVKQFCVVSLKEKKNVSSEEAVSPTCICDVTVL